MWTRDGFRGRFADGVIVALCSGSLYRAVLGFGVLGFGVLGFGVLGSASLLGCASQQDTATALAVAGTAAVIVGASMAADNGQCYSSGEGGPPYCSPGLSRAARHAGTATAIAGAGMAGAGYALQPKGPDQNHHAHNPPPGPPSYRLVRPPAEPEPESESDPSVGSAASDPNAVAPEGESTSGAPPEPTATPEANSATPPAPSSPAAPVPPSPSPSAQKCPPAGQGAGRVVPDGCKTAAPSTEEH